MSTIRVRKNVNYFAAANEPFNDAQLSWEARGLMGYLLSKPDNWEVRLRDVLEQGPAGEHKVDRMLAELRKAGYISRQRVTCVDGTFTWITTIYESPSLNPDQSTMGRKSPNGYHRAKIQSLDNPPTGKPPHVLSTESISTERDDDEREISQRLAALSTLYSDNIGVITPLGADVLRNMAIDYPEAWYKPAFEIAVKNQARNLNYVETILRSWKEHGFGWKPGGNSIKSAKISSNDDVIRQVASGT